MIKKKDVILEEIRFYVKGTFWATAVIIGLLISILISVVKW